MKTVSRERIERAQRALFEALGQVVIIERMVQGAEETGSYGQGVRLITVQREHGRDANEREDVQSELRHLANRLEVIDERLEELKKEAANG